jgi:hypothetical protein
LTKAVSLLHLRGSVAFACRTRALQRPKHERIAKGRALALVP